MAGHGLGGQERQHAEADKVSAIFQQFVLERNVNLSNGLVDYEVHLKFNLCNQYFQRCNSKFLKLWPYIFLFGLQILV